jgi:glycosyltransferase involved in cell wall biosynthesis
MGLRSAAVESLVTLRPPDRAVTVHPERTARPRDIPRDEQPLVSVVTPVYNTEAYVAECIESVLAQTYENWEYVIADNRSTDGTLEIARRYAEQDERIRVQTYEEHLSIIPNWNRAVREIAPTSKYCKVVHADDWLYEECLMRMVAVAEKHPAVGIVGAYRLDENRVNLDGLPYWLEAVSGRDVCRYSLLGGRYLFGSPTALLIRSEFVREREKFYNESNLHADTEVCYELLKDVDFGFVHQVLTFTRRHNEAMTSFANRTKTHIPSRLLVLLKYGPAYLERDEFERELRKLTIKYVRSLLKGTAQLRIVRDEPYRSFHRNLLADLAARMANGYGRHGPDFVAAKVVLSGLAKALRAVG